MGSDEFYIDDQVELARQEHAPPDATYRRDDGTWATTDQIWRDDTRRHLGLEPLPFQQPALTTMVPQLRLAVMWIEAFRDRFRMVGVDQVDDHTLMVRFATGWSVQLTVEILPPPA